MELWIGVYLHFLKDAAFGKCLQNAAWRGKWHEYVLLKALGIKKDPNQFNYHIYMNENLHRLKDNGEVTYRVTKSVGDVGRLNNGAADVLAVKVSKWNGCAYELGDEDCGVVPVPLTPE
ncbi:hypothetical protein Tco_0251307 [Tanacetum coccineum]